MVHVLITPLYPTLTGELNDLDFWLSGPDKSSDAKSDTPKQPPPPPAAAEDTTEEAGKKRRKKGEKVIVYTCTLSLITNLICTPVPVPMSQTLGC